MTTAELARNRNDALFPISFEAEAGAAGLSFSQLPLRASSVRRRSFLLEVHGDLDEELVSRMRESLFSAAASSPGRIVIDLADVSFLDGMGLRTLIAARRRCVAGGTTFALRRPSSAVRRLLSLTHLEGVFDVEPAPAP